MTGTPVRNHESGDERWPLVVFVLLGLGLGVWIAVASTALSLVAIVFVVVVGLQWRLLAGIPRKARRQVLGVLALAVGVRLVAIVTLPEILEATTGYAHVADGDPLFWERRGWELTQRPIDEWEVVRGKSYHLVVGLLYKAFGHHVVVVRLANVVGLAGLMLYTYRIAADVYGHGIGIVTALYIALSPSFVILTVRTGHDMLSIALTTAVLYYLFQFRWYDDTVAFGGFVASLICLYWLRHQLALFLPLVAVAWYAVLFVVDQREALVGSPLRRGLTATAFLLGTGAVILLGVSSGFFTALDARLDSWVAFKLAQLGPSSGLVTSVMSLPTSLRAFGGLVVFVLLPFPQWEILLNDSWLTIKLYSMETFLLYLLVPFALLGIKRSVVEKFSESFPHTLFTVGFATLVSVVYTGASVARFRAVVLGFIVMFAAYGTTVVEHRRRFVLAYYLLFAAGMAGYIGLKGV